MFAHELNATLVLAIEIQVLQLQHAQDTYPKSHIMCPRAPSKRLSNSGKPGAVNTSLSTVMPVPVPNHTLSEESFPNTQPKPH